MPRHKVPDDRHDCGQQNNLGHDQRRTTAKDLLDVWFTHLDRLEGMRFRAIEQDEQWVKSVACRDEEVECEKEWDDEL